MRGSKASIRIAWLGALAAVLLLLSTAPAAAFRTRGYTTRHTEVASNSHDIARAVVSCPANQVVVSGGAYWFQPGQALSPVIAADGDLLVSTPINGGRGWLAIGFGFDDVHLAVTVHCLPPTSVGGYVVKTRLLVPVPSPDGGGLYEASGTVTCPQGRTAVTGGAGWYSTDQQRFVPADAHHDLVTSSAPLSARQWWAAGYSYFNFSTANRFRVALLCAPSSRVGPFSITRQTFDVAPAKVAATYQSCPAGTEIVAAGAYWHEPGQSPQNSPVSNQNLAALAPTLDKKGDWFAGYNLRATSERLTAIVECRLI